MLLRICACLAMVTATACVADSSADTESAATTALAGGSGAHRKPPKEAFDACASSTAGATCSFDIDGHHVTGTCKTGPTADAPLACAPDHPPPPQEAIDACAGATDGAACSFEIDGHSCDGTCTTGPDGNGIACKPTNPPPQP